MKENKCGDAKIVKPRNREQKLKVQKKPDEICEYTGKPMNCDGECHNCDIALPYFIGDKW